MIHKAEKLFEVGDKLWLQLNKERLEGLGRKIKYL